MNSHNGEVFRSKYYIKPKNSENEDIIQKLCISDFIDVRIRTNTLSESLKISEEKRDSYASAVKYFATIEARVMKRFV